jgi:DNA-binding NarL/FixJ family response regulator/tetratricopeptide (TPR) repeat protein
LPGSVGSSRGWRTSHDGLPEIVVGATMVDLIIEGMPVRVSSPILIGRSGELARLRAGLALARQGRTSATLIAGEAGVGKTRLVAEFSEMALADGAVVLLGGCIDLGDGALPYAPVIEALRGLVRRADGDEIASVFGQGRSELARLVPDLGPVAEEHASGLSLGSAQGRLFELLLGVFERLAARAPVVFMVEDLHWSDQSTRDLLGFLVRNLRDVAVTLVFTYRSDELHRRHPLLPLVAELERSGRVERIELDRFDRSESAEQLQAIAGHDLDPALIESIHARAGGNAFFAEELLVAAGDAGRTDLPATLRDVLLARLADLPETTHDFLRVASAAGQRVDPSLLAAAVAMDEGTVYEALRECVGRQILVPDTQAGTERYTFRHALLQEAVYDDLLPGERTRLHSAFAQTLEARSTEEGGHEAELAYHWYAAHDLPRALESAVAAGAAAANGYAFPEALAQYERAIEMWDQVPDAEKRAGADRVQLLIAAAGVARFKEAARAVALIHTAIELVDATLDPTRAGLLHERLGRYAWIAGQHDRAYQAYRAAMELIPADPPSEARARAEAGLAQILWLGSQFAESRTAAGEALATARAVGARDIEGHALNTRGADRGMTGDIEGGIEDLRTALAIAEEVGNLDDIGRAYANWIPVLDTAGRLHEALELSEIALEKSARLGLMGFFGTHVLAFVSDINYRLGHWDEAEAAARRAEVIGPLGINRILVSELLGRLNVSRGEFSAAATWLTPVVTPAERAGDVQFVVPVRASLAELALWQVRPDEAVDHVGRGLALMDFLPEVRIGELHALGLRAHADAAELARMRRSPDEVEAHVAAGEHLLAAVESRHADVVATRPAFVSESEAWLRLSEAESTRLRREADPDAWTVAVAAWEAIERPYPAAYCRWREAEARLAARGDRDLAANALRAGITTATQLGAEPLRRELTNLAARARLPLEADQPAEPVLDDAARLGLTPREREVLALVALGRTNRQIAEELFITENTAGVHVSNILGKLEVTGRGEAAAIAYRLGLVESTQPM